MVSEVLKEHKKNIAKLKNLRIDREKLLEDMEGIQETLAQDEEEFSKDEILDELSLSATGYDNTSAPTNAFSSRTENAALNLEKEVENQKAQYKSRKTELNEKYYIDKRKYKLLEEEIKELEREVEKTKNKLESLKRKPKFIIESKYVEGLEWEEVLKEFNEEFPITEIQTIDGLKKIAYNALEEMASI